MRRYLLDTNAVSGWINERGSVRAHSRAARQAGCRLGTCIPVVAELYFGAEHSASRDRALNDLRFGLSQFVVWPFGLDAAVALTLGNCTVVTSDSDLSAVPGLAVENWAT